MSKMVETATTNPEDEDQARADRRTRIRYAILTAALFVPLLIAFAAVRNLYPFSASTMMLGVDLQSDREYFVLRGETVTGEEIDLPPIKLTNALSGRNWSLVSATVGNKSFNIRSPHPATIAKTAHYGGRDNLPPAALLEDLLREWGTIYNSRLPESSDQRLRSVRLDAYRWEGGINGEYARFVRSWNAVL